MTQPSRRDFVKATLAAPLGYGLLGGAGVLVLGGAVLLAPTPAIADDDEPITPEDVEGPYFKAKSPERVKLVEDGIPGTPMKLTGHVWTREKKPVAGALIDFWQCDGKGVYDNDTFKLRGHQYTGEDGSFTLETVLPGLYPGRTRHIHVKAQAPKKSILTTQLYFPDEPQNKKDRLFKDALLIKWADGEKKAATFNFVLNV